EGLTSVHAGTTVPSRRTRSPASGAGSAQECGPEELHDVLLASREGVRGERCDVEQTLEERLVGEVAEQRSVPRDEELSSVLALERAGLHLTVEVVGREVEHRAQRAGEVDREVLSAVDRFAT